MHRRPNHTGAHRSPGRTRRLVAAVTVAATALIGLTVAEPVGAGHETAPPGASAEPALPIVFVHGFSGSGAQYETQALRWASNGYPNVVTAIDRVGLGFNAQMDAFVDDLLERTGDDRVYVLGHSLGTSLMNGYLNSSPDRAARVAKYIAIDGASAASCPGGVDADGNWNVPCMGIWGRGSQTRAMGPDHNARFPEQGHTEVVTSADSFAAQYRFLTGTEPATTLVLPEPPGRVEIAGKALNFPANTGIAGATVELWRVHPSTGARTTDEPLSSTVVGSDGVFGPWTVNGQHRYELSVTRQSDDGPRTQHFYYEPWIRSNHLLRLNLSPLDSPLSTGIARGPHATVSVVRQKEWWGNNTVDATNVDDLFIGTTRSGGADEAPVDIINAGTAPYTASTIAVIGFDIGVDQQSDPCCLQNLGAFLSGVDIYMPAADPTDGVVTFELHQRRTPTPQVINTPNWSSEAGHGMTVTFREWVQPFETWGGCMSARPSPCR